MRYFYNRDPTIPETWLDEYAAAHFNSPTRSTVPLLDALRRDEPPDFLEELLQQAGFDLGEAGLNAETLDLHVEYAVASGQGQGPPSQTDLMAIGAGPPRRVLAIEAKWTEPRDKDTVSKFLNGTDLSDEENNRKKRMRGWIDYIRPYSDTEIAIEDCDNLVCQMVHRAASACSAAGEDGRPALAYLIFQSTAEPTTQGHYRTDLKNLRTVVGNAEGFPFFLTSVVMQPTNAFRVIEHLPKRKATTGEQVRAALNPSAAPLFEFTQHVIEEI